MNNTLQTPNMDKQHPTEQVNALMQRFGEVQNELRESMTAVDDLNNKEIETGFMRGLRGKTDEQIAGQVKSLGLNLHATQKVVMFLIDLNHSKNEVLRGFYDALVTKLIDLDKEQEGMSEDLSVSQRNERKIVYQLKEQIENRLVIEDNIEANASNIEINKSQIGANQNSIESNTSLIEQNQESIEANSERIGDNLNRLAELGESLAVKDSLDDAQSKQLSQHEASITELKKQLIELQGGVGRDFRHYHKLLHLYGAVGIAAFVIAVIGFISI